MLTDPSTFFHIHTHTHSFIFSFNYHFAIKIQILLACRRNCEKEENMIFFSCEQMLLIIIGKILKME